MYEPLPFLPVIHLRFYLKKKDETFYVEAEQNKFSTFTVITACSQEIFVKIESFSNFRQATRYGKSFLAIGKDLYLEPFSWTALIANRMPAATRTMRSSAGVRYGLFSESFREFFRSTKDQCSGFLGIFVQQHWITLGNC